MNENEIVNDKYSFSDNISKIDLKLDSNKDNSKDLLNALEENINKEKKSENKSNIIEKENKIEKTKYHNDENKAIVNKALINKIKKITKRNNNLQHFNSTGFSSIDNFCNSILKQSKLSITNNNASDSEQLKYDFLKEISKLKPNKNNNFIYRMKFDVIKRQNIEKKMNFLVEKTKNKINENKRSKTFNKLIEDANRRILAQDNLNTLKNKLDQIEGEKVVKKYKKNQWENIYKERFEKYKRLYDEKLKAETEKKKEEKIKEEKKEIEMCKKIKKPMKNIIEYANKMYEDAKKRNKKKQNMIQYEKLFMDLDINKNSINKLKIKRNKNNKQKSLDFANTNKDYKKSMKENVNEFNIHKSLIQRNNSKSAKKLNTNLDYSNKSMANKIFDDYFFKKLYH